MSSSNCAGCCLCKCENEEEILFYAKGGGTVRLGPFKSFVEASEAIRNPLGDHYDDAFIWSERKSDALKRDSKEWSLKEQIIKPDNK